MTSITSAIEIKIILFESNDPEVLLKGTINDGHLTYETDMIITQTQLNMVMNQLQKQNQALKLEDFIVEEKMYNNEIMYTAEFSEEVNKRIDLFHISTQTIKQIRA